MVLVIERLLQIETMDLKEMTSMSWRTFKKNMNLDISGLKYSSDKSYIDASLANNS